MADLLYKDLSYKIQGACYQIYKTFGTAFKESVYHNALIEELKQAGLNVDDRKRVDIYYRGKKVGTYVPDLVVNDVIFIEIKCKPKLTREDIRQFWYYLKGSEYKVGYFVNFGSPREVELIRRVYDTARASSRIFA